MLKLLPSLIIPHHTVKLPLCTNDNEFLKRNVASGVPADLAPLKQRRNYFTASILSLDRIDHCRCVICLGINLSYFASL